MRRTLVQFDEAVYEKLRETAFKQGRSIASVVRELVAVGLEPEKPRRPKRIRQFLSVSAGRSHQGELSPVSERHDEALTRLKR
jgi:hypothetical protein